MNDLSPKAISWPTALKRGFFRHCPRCGKGPFFKGYLLPQSHCLVCELNFEPLKADDGPAYITMGLVCLCVVPFYFIFQALYDPPFAIAVFISLPLTFLIILGLLPLIKGAFMAAIWKSMGEDK